jgi:ElaB/YqjD/DUF883 family membrane-anchored ribosome-binding protein
MNSTLNSSSNKEYLLQELNAVAAETSALMKHAADTAGDQGEVLLESLETRFHELQARFHDARERVSRQTRELARATDQYVHAHPWQAVGAVAATGLITGLLIGTWMRRP